MGETPFGNELVVLFLTIFSQLTLRVFLPKVWSKAGIYIVSVGLFVSLCLSVQPSPWLENSGSALFQSDRMSQIFVIIILLFAFLNHLNFMFLDKNRDSEMLFFDVVMVFFSEASRMLIDKGMPKVASIEDIKVAPNTVTRKESIAHEKWANWPERNDSVPISSGTNNRQVK